MLNHIPISTVKQNCHKDCKQKTLHTSCLPVQPLRTPIMAHLLYKLETIPLNDPSQSRKRLAGYAGVEQILKSK